MLASYAPTRAGDDGHSAFESPHRVDLLVSAHGASLTQYRRSAGVGSSTRPTLLG